MVQSIQTHGDQTVPDAKWSALQCMSVCIMILGCVCHTVSGTLDYPGHCGQTIYNTVNSPHYTILILSTSRIFFLWTGAGTDVFP